MGKYMDGWIAAKQLHSEIKRVMSATVKYINYY